MTEKQRKLAEKALNLFGLTIGQRVVTGLGLALLGFIIATGQTMVDTVVEKKLRESQTVKAIHAKIAVLEAKQDTLRVRMDTVERKVETVDRKIDALIGIMIDANPKVKEAARRRAQQNQDTKDVRDALVGSRQ